MRWDPYEEFEKTSLNLYNIPKDIARKAYHLELKAMATGGGVDYVYKDLGQNNDGSRRVVLLAHISGGSGPDSLSDPADLVVMLNDDWTQQIGFRFKTAADALTALSESYEFNA